MVMGTHLYPFFISHENHLVCSYRFTFSAGEEHI